MTIYVVTTGALNGREKPITGKVLYVRHKGDKLDIRKIVTASGQKWGETQHGTFYSMRYLRREGAAPAVRINPVPGRGVTTPWGKKPPYRNGRPLYWTTRGHHTGTDRAAGQGETVRAMRGGTVVRRWDSVLGNVALLYTTDKDGDRVTFWFCHLSKIVKTGKVKAGETIGKVGQTGTGARGPHLHLEVRKGWTTSWAGTDYNPELYF